ncbi:MAG: cephalosporin hydroxylase family protein [Agrobacterium cavarae]|uniref:Cephalosporin hydroxylase n=1 Tax=Agrobacterium cavarae TaxID=2528239 RepID=A0ABY1Y5F1_9HYPH|nr:cephalosporin hydroxylase family protein [Agrobacterium cavarae]KQM31050.1 cephalosporin hydroxylase [Rhizobium sp. Leaf202]KQN81728.1 cephalosporin hydroxylase [Rhizobium sp. Leaf68]TBN10896.1 cephalosporin hydroxylase [Agrobacterium cavarae]
MNAIDLFEEERKATVDGYRNDAEFQSLSYAWRESSMAKRYVYNFDWLGRPIIQYPQDIQAMQEIIWSTKPDLIIETGIAHGGSLILSASMLALLDMCEAIEAGTSINPAESKRKVIGVDIDIRPHNRDAIERHPMASRIQMLQGSSVAKDIVEVVSDAAASYGRVMVCLDSMHTHDHVLAELEAYAPLVTSGCYCVVFDTFVEDLPKDFFKDRPWNPGDSPKSAVADYLSRHPDFQVDKEVEGKLLITVAPDGFLKRA